MTTPSSSSFQNKIVVITGGASGIGKALAKAFDREGAIVIVIDLKGSQAARLEITSQDGDASGRRHLAFDCDVTDPDKLSKVLEVVKDRYQRIDIYCSNAGIVFPPTKFCGDDDKVTKHSPKQWNRILQVNLLSHVTALRLLLPDWESGKGDGIFCMTASAAGLLTMVGDASYGVTKAAAVSLAEHLAISHGNVVQVHCLCPQAVDTPFVADTKAVNAAMTDGVVSPEFVADCTLDAIQKKEFFIFPHPEVPTYFERKAKDHARWLKGMQRLRNRMMQSKLQWPQGMQRLRNRMMQSKLQQSEGISQQFLATSQSHGGVPTARRRDVRPCHTQHDRTAMTSRAIGRREGGVQKSNTGAPQVSHQGIIRRERGVADEREKGVESRQEMSAVSPDKHHIRFIPRFKPFQLAETSPSPQDPRLVF